MIMNGYLMEKVLSPHPAHPYVPIGWTSTPSSIQFQLKRATRTSSSLTKHVKKLFVIPKEVGKDDVKILSIGAEKFTFLPNGHWISFVISPYRILGHG